MFSSALRSGIEDQPLVSDASEVGEQSPMPALNLLVQEAHTSGSPGLLIWNSRRDETFFINSSQKTKLSGLLPRSCASSFACSTSRLARHPLATRLSNSSRPGSRGFL